MSYVKYKDRTEAQRERIRENARARKPTEAQLKRRRDMASARYANPLVRGKILANAKARYAADPGKFSAAKARYSKAHPEKKPAYMRKYYQENRPRLLAAIRKRAGVPEPTYPSPVMCEVSGCPRKALCADHEHLTGEFRGWLCAPCNRAASKHHTPTLLRALADYLEQRS